MRFQALKLWRQDGEPFEFTEKNPPSWLIGGLPGSTMDNRWFWNDRVLTLAVGETVDTDFHRIERVE